MENFNYTIIIPHKNIPNLLWRCLNSIPERDDIQVIIIDDNSDLSKVEFEHFPGLGRQNVEVYFTKEGKGAGYARNIGLKHAKGKWLIFSDADDFFEHDFVKILDAHLNEEADIIYFATRSVDNETLTKVRTRFDIKPFIRKRKINKLRYTHYYPWGKMIRAQFIKLNQIYFEEVSASNDVYFSVMAGIKANNVVGYNECIYVSTVRQSSLTYNKTTRRLDDRIAVSRHINFILKEHNLSLYRNNRFQIVLHYKDISIEEYRKNLKLFFKEESFIDILWDVLRYWKHKIIDKHRIDLNKKV